MMRSGSNKSGYITTTSSEFYESSADTSLLIIAFAIQANVIRYIKEDQTEIIVLDNWTEILSLTPDEAKKNRLVKSSAKEIKISLYQ
jgi:hypothetical protein